MRLKISENVKFFLPDVEDYSFDFDLSEKEERYFLHRVLGRLSNLQTQVVSLSRVKTNRRLQEMISEQDVKSLLDFGFLEKITNEEKGFVLTIKFDTACNISFVDVFDEEKCSAVRIPNNEEVFQKAIYAALNNYFRLKK